MLPILRIVPVGGVLLAIVVLLLALTPPDGTSVPLSQGLTTPRAPLIEREEHPEWRQMMLRAAMRRADELNRLLSLTDTTVQIELPVPVANRPTGSENTTAAKIPDSPVVAPVPSASLQPQPAATPTPSSAGAPKPASEVVAGLPAAAQGNADPDVTGSIDEKPGATIPIDIGETSSTELPITAPETTPPIIRTPERPAHQSQRPDSGKRQPEGVVSVKPPKNSVDEPAAVRPEPVRKTHEKRAARSPRTKATQALSAAELEQYRRAQKSAAAWLPSANIPTRDPP